MASSRILAIRPDIAAVCGWSRAERNRLREHGCRGDAARAVIETTALGRGRRRRSSGDAWERLPTLRAAERALLERWASGDAPLRRWSSLQALAGAGGIEAAEALLGRLLEAGVVAVDERFDAGRWWSRSVVWSDLPRLQRALGLQSLAERDAARDAALLELARIAEQSDALQPAALDLQASRLSTPLLLARTGLLQSLLGWTLEQRSGVRQDFALHARPHTKAITEAEWRWLEAQLDLAALGVERFAPLVWLAGPMRLSDATGATSLAPLPFAGLPADWLLGLLQVDAAPERYWVIENRASFERQARRREATQCVLWVPGRPSPAWCEAVGRLIASAPARAQVSADADPAGIEIALAVGEVWAAAGLAWSPHAMEPRQLSEGKTQPLNDYDRASLARALARDDLPPALRELAVEIGRLGRKAEQEGWL